MNRALVVVVTAISACSTLPPVVDGGSDGGPVTGGAFDAGQPLPAPSFVHVFEGAFSPGASAVSRVGAVVHFTFIGDEPLDYAIDTASAEVQRGLIHVVEASLGVTLVDRGGLTWKRRDGTLLAPWELAEQATTTLVSETLDTASGTLALRYRDAVGGVTAEKTYSFQLVGKALRIRVVADASVRRRALDGYNGLRLGGTSRMLRPFETNVPYMGSVPVIGFRGAGDAGAFTSALVDWYQSSASDVRPWGPTETDGGLELFYGTENDPNELGELAAPIDETVHVIVSRDVTQLFPRLAHAPSPYRELTAGRLFVTAGAVYPDSWASYGEYFAQLQSLGVDDVMGVVFPWQQYAFNLLDPRSDNASVLGCPLAQMTFSGAYDAGPLGVLQVVDPASRANVEAGHRCFSAMMEQARDAGYLLALYQPPGNQDQQGFGPYGDGVAYPSQVPLSFPDWAPVALQLPAVNSAYDAGVITRDEAGAPKLGWDTRLNLVGSTWDFQRGGPQGHPLHVDSPTHLASEVVTQLSRVRDRYRPGAAFIDAQSELPGGVAIDQRSTSGKAHSIREGLIGNREAFEALRRYAQGPLFGEGHYWRARQWDSFESGLWDGRHRGFGVPVTPQGSLVPNRDAPVIPDFELSAVFPRAAGHHGMGWEGDEHWGPGLTFPVDGTNGRATAFVDSYFVNTITYGHAPYVGSNGAVLNNYWTLEGTLRSAVLVGAVQELLSRSRVATVRYVDGAGAELTLSEALLAPLDLANARVHVTYESGAQLWANHDLGSGTSWSVVAPHLPPSQTAQVQRGFSVPGNGFVVSDGRGFLAFSATPEGGEARMDYVRAPGRWEAITGRGVAATYDGFPQAAVLAALPPGRVSAYRLGTVVRNDVHNLAIGASGGLWHYPTRSWFGPGRVDVTALGAQPAAVALSLRVQRNALRVGAQVGLSARVAYANDAWRDLTPLASFQVMPAGIVSVDQGGAALGLALGTAVVTATWDPDGPAGPQLPLTSAPVTLVVQ